MNMQGVRTTGCVQSINDRIRTQRTNNGPDFSSLLKEKSRGVTFSAHAETRMKSRGIAMEPDDLSRLSQAVDGAAAKGCRDSLIMLRDRAFVVSVKNRTVITAMDGESIKNNIFTNIDSTVFAG